MVNAIKHTRNLLILSTKEVLDCFHVYWFMVIQRKLLIVLIFIGLWYHKGNCFSVQYLMVTQRKLLIASIFISSW